jgi:hypothetical protein
MLHIIWITETTNKTVIDWWRRRTLGHKPVSSAEKTSTRTYRHSTLSLCPVLTRIIISSLVTELASCYAYFSRSFICCLGNKTYPYLICRPLDVTVKLWRQCAAAHDARRTPHYGCSYMQPAGGQPMLRRPMERSPLQKDLIFSGMPPFVQPLHWWCHIILHFSRSAGEAFSRSNISHKVFFLRILILMGLSYKSGLNHRISIIWSYYKGYICIMFWSQKKSSLQPLSTRGHDILFYLER